MKKIKIQTTIIDKLPFEINTGKNGEGYIELTDEEVFNLIKTLCKDERLIKIHLKELINVFEKELQSYAENQFNKFGRGEFYEDEGENK